MGRFWRRTLRETIRSLLSLLISATGMRGSDVRCISDKNVGVTRTMDTHFIIQNHSPARSQVSIYAVVARAPLPPTPSMPLFQILTTKP